MERDALLRIVPRAPGECGGIFTDRLQVHVSVGRVAPDDEVGVAFDTGSGHELLALSRIVQPQWGRPARKLNARSVRKTDRSRYHPSDKPNNRAGSHPESVSLHPSDGEQKSYARGRGARNERRPSDRAAKDACTRARNQCPGWPTGEPATFVLPERRMRAILEAEPSGECPRSPLHGDLQGSDPRPTPSFCSL